MTKKISRNHSIYSSHIKSESAPKQSALAKRDKKFIFINPYADNITYLKLLDRAVRRFGTEEAATAHANNVGAAIYSTSRQDSLNGLPVLLSGCLLFISSSYFSVFRSNSSLSNEEKGLITILSVSTGFAIYYIAKFALKQPVDVIPNSLTSFIEIEIKKIIEDSQTNKKTALLIRADDLYTKDNAFALTRKRSLDLVFLRHDLLDLKRRGYAICCVSADPKREVRNLFSTVKDNSIDLVCIKGHGLSSGIKIHSKFWFDGISPDSQIFMQELAKKVRTRPCFILYSCLTGWGEHNIAKTLSMFFQNARVHAPADCAILSGGCKLYRLYKKGTSLFPQFTGISSIIPTRTYQNGKEIMKSYSLIPYVRENLLVYFFKISYFVLIGKITRFATKIF